MKARALALTLAVGILTLSVITALYVEDTNIFAQAEDDALDASQTTSSQDDILLLTPMPARPSTPEPLEPSQIVAQEKAMDFMKNMLPVDLSKYAISLRSNSIMHGVPLAKNDSRNIINILFELNSTDSYLHIGFAFEKGIMTSCSLTPIEGQLISSKQYDNPLVAAKDFLERYQAYTETDSSNLLAMLDNVDTTKDYTITTENTKFAITNDYFGGRNETAFRWIQMIYGAESRIGTSLVFDTDGNFISLGDSRGLYTIGDMSTIISKEQAIDVALENLKSYTYDMYDGVVIKDFKVSRDNIEATLVTAAVDYELRPYWDIRMMLEEVYPGNVHGITAFIWADTGEVISYSNMAFGGATTDNTNSAEAELAPDYTLAAVSAAVIAASIVAALVLVMKKGKIRGKRMQPHAGCGLALDFLS